MKDYKLTLVGLVISVCILFITHIADLDLFEAVIDFLSAFEEYEIDEFIIPLLIFAFFSFADLSRRQKQNKIELEKIKIYEAMLSSAHHILNNFINQIKLFKMTADETPGFSPSVLSLYKEIIKEATMQIKALSSISNIDEESIKDSVAPK